MKNNQLDVVIVTKNRPIQLAQCVRHICANTVKPASIIIIDSSPSYNEEIKTSIKIACHKQGIQLKYHLIQDKGVGYARNKGMQKVTTRFFAFIDDDELVSPAWINTIVDFFRTHPRVQVLTGPKIPLFPSNYWNRVWKALVKDTFTYSGPAGFIPSGNSAYDIVFLRKNALTFDERFIHCSEDQGFSFALHRKGAQMYHLRQMSVRHACRTTTDAITKQWFFYGTSIHQYHQWYLGSGNIMTPLAWRRTYRNLKQIYPYRTQPDHWDVRWGIMFIHIVFLVGFLYSFSLPTNNDQ